MKNIFLFGAGASTGCGGTNFKVPVGKNLFSLLKNQFLNTWGNLPQDLDIIFSNNFEAGMQVIWERYSTNVPLLMKDLAVLLSSATINNREDNLYFKVFVKTKEQNLIQDTVFSTLNYDCLLEIAAHSAGLKINYFDAPNSNSATVWKLHGSCNFIAKGIKATNGVSYTRGVVFDTAIKAIQPAQVRDYCYGDNALYPVMSIYMKGKPLQIAKTVIKKLQSNWQNEIKKAKNIILVGVRPNLEDNHIWDHISSSDAKIFYCGGETDFNK